ncbi:MAG TPA: AraC family transcriptional regulator [Dongiaceae bacterium]|nr:AraC family transcriptional regulator [Dongiaceae bacterium]
MVHPPTGTVRIGYVRALLDYLQQQGTDVTQIFSAELLAELDTPSLNERLPIKRWGDLLERAITVTGDSALPLKVADELKPRHWGVFAYAAMTCKNLAEVVLILERYERLIDEVNDTRLLVLGENGALQWIPRVEAPVPAFMQLSLASWVVFARRYTGRANLMAEVHFTFSAPTDITPYHLLFSNKVLFDQPVTQLIFPLQYLQLPITYHDADTHRIMLSQAQSQFDALTTESGFRRQMTEAIRRRLSSGRVTLEQLAEDMGLPSRTLQYQLETEGTSFRQLLDEVRAERARFYLQDPDMTLVDVSFLLGYSEQSPFNKAFKRWTGETPGEYRKRAAKPSA